MFPAAVLLNGCMIGGWDDDRPEPRGAWYGARTEVPTTQVSSPASRPIPGDAEDPESTAAITSAAPEQIIAAARALLAPAYGPAMVDDHKGPPEHRLLVAILQRLDDPAAHLTTWRQISP